MSQSFANQVSFLSLIRKQVTRRGDSIAYSFLPDGEDISENQTYNELWREANGIAEELRKRFDPNDRIILLYPPGLEFLPAFVGCMLAGMIPVVSSYSRQIISNQRLEGIIKDSEPKLVLTQKSELSALERIKSEMKSMAPLEILQTDLISGRDYQPFSFNESNLNENAFMLYTSGSTAKPRGVLVSYHNLLHNLDVHRVAMQLTLNCNDDTRFVSWLPHFHQMGLVSILLLCLGVGGRCFLMPPLAFVKHPVRWLRTISQYRGMITGGPNFSYDLCSDSILNEEKQELDLSTIRVAFVSSEPIHRSTLTNFREAFSPCGFEEKYFIPAYGQAESTTLISWERGVSSVWVNKRALERGRIDVSKAPDASVDMELVASGRLDNDVSIRIVNPENKTLIPDGEIGEIWLRSGSIVNGYWGKQELSHSNFNVHFRPQTLSPNDVGYLRTGDYGFVYGGLLYITGRLKELLIIRGRNLYPQDLERTVELSHPFLSQGRGAVFQPNKDSRQSIICVQEVTQAKLPDHAYDDLAQGIQKQVVENHQVAFSEIIFVRKNAVPRTTSGKIGRVLCCEQWKQGPLRGELARVTFPEKKNHNEVDPLSAYKDVEQVRMWLKRMVMQRIDLPDINFDESLHNMGFDSLGLVSFLGEIEKATNQTIPLEKFVFNPTLQNLAALVCDPSYSVSASVDAKIQKKRSMNSKCGNNWLRSRLLHAGPQIKRVPFPYGMGIHTLKSIVDETGLFERLLEQDIRVLRKVYTEVEPNIEYHDFLKKSMMANFWVSWKYIHIHRMDYFRKWVRFSGTESVVRDLDRKRGVILAGTHTPWMSCLYHWPLLNGRKVTYLGHLKPQHFEKIGESGMAAALAKQGDTEESRRAIRTALLLQAKTTLKEGGVVVCFPDDIEGYGGLNVPFFKRMRPVRPGLAEMAVDCDATIYPFSAKFSNKGVLSFLVDAPLNTKSDSADIIINQYSAWLKLQWQSNLESCDWRSLRQYLNFNLIDETATTTE